MVTNWLPISGNPKIKKNEIEFFPQKDENDEILSLEKQRTNVIKSDVNFKDGTVEFKVMLWDSKDKVQLWLGVEGAEPIILGLNSRKGAYAIAKRKNGDFEYLDYSGVDVELPKETWLTIRIKSLGSNLELWVNNILVCKAGTNFAISQLELIYAGINKAIVKDFKVEAQLPEAFVVMQFTDEFNTMYTEVIKPVCERYGYEVIRADDMYTNGLLIEDITSAIKNSSLIIADITPDNPNVYYELGYAHAIKKPTIMLCDKTRQKLPFDISGLRCIFYENSIAGKSKVEKLLTKHLSAI